MGKDILDVVDVLYFENRKYLLSTLFTLFKSFRDPAIHPDIENILSEFCDQLVAGDLAMVLIRRLDVRAFSVHVFFPTHP